MFITIKDLKGFDFSKKYLILDSHVKIDRNECFEQMTNKYACQKYLNPYAPLDLSFINVIKENKEMRITELLQKYNNETVNNCHEIYNELSKSNYNLLDFNPEFTTNKFPTNLSKEDLSEYFTQMNPDELNSLIESFSAMELELFDNLLWGEDSDYFYEKCFGNNYGPFHSKYNTVFKIKTEYYICLILHEFGFEITDEDIHKIFLILYDEPLYNLNDINYDLEDLNDIYIKSKYLDFLNSIKQFGTKYRPIFPDEDEKFELKKRHVHRAKFKDFVSRNTHNNLHNKYIDFAIKNNHLEKETGLSHITYTSNDDIKEVLRKYNLKVSGNKQELINRIKDNLSIQQINEEFPSNDDTWNLSQEGTEYLNRYYYLTLLKPFIPSVFNLAEFNEICELNPEFSPEIILYALINENWIITDDATQDIKELIEEVQLRNKSHVAFNLEKINLDLSIKLYESVNEKDSRCPGCERLRIIYKRKKDYENELRILKRICNNNSDCRFNDRIDKLEKLIG